MKSMLLRKNESSLEKDSFTKGFFSSEWKFGKKKETLQEKDGDPNFSSKANTNCHVRPHKDLEMPI